jgi:predicted dehydrogenase
MTSKIRVGIIGFGFSAKTFHLPFLKVLESYDVRKIYTTQTSAHLTHPLYTIYVSFRRRLGRSRD